MVNPSRTPRVYLENGTRLPLSQIKAVCARPAPDYSPSFVKNSLGDYVRVSKPAPEIVYTLHLLNARSLAISPKDYRILRLYVERRDCSFFVSTVGHLLNLELITCTPSPAYLTRTPPPGSYEVYLDATTTLTLTPEDYARLRAGDGEASVIDVAQEPDTYLQVQALEERISR